MYWNHDSRLTAGGYWYCAVAHRERQRRYYATKPLGRNRKLLVKELRRQVRLQAARRSHVEPRPALVAFLREVRHSTLSPEG
jgi:hypothetical protein